MNSERPFLSHFSPQWTKPEYLEAILVQRGDLLAESVAAVRESVLTDRRHHLLFIGPRGAGKTHLVTLIQHRLRQDAGLADRLAHSPADSPARAYLETAHRLELSGPNLRHELYRRDLDLAGPEQCDDITLEKARALAEDGQPADWIRLGVILMARKEWEEAIQIFTRVIAQENATPDEVAEALGRRGYAHFLAGRPLDANGDYTRAIELPGAPHEPVAIAFNNRGVSSSEQGQHEAVLRDLGGMFALLDEKVARDVLTPRLHFKAEAFVTAAFSVTTEAARWTRLLTEFAGHFARFGGLTQLGDAVVKHLPTIAASPLNHAAWDAWARAWDAARAALPEKDRDLLDIPLRLLRTGLAWLKTRDDGQLLTLPREERRLLREALNLPSEK